jgi:cyclohexa-1,5-dienecarbonyl-CoA hydratase
VGAVSERQFLRLTREGQAIRITLARPPLNVMNLQMMEELNAVLDEVAADGAVKALLVAAEGKAFSAGVAVEDHIGERVRPMLDTFHAVFRRLHALDVPTAAALQGAALGGGAELAAFCDVVVASEAATIGQPEIKVGVFPPVAALCYPWRVGVPRTVQLLCSGQILGAAEAYRIGLVDRVVPAERLEEAVREELARFTAQSAAVLRLTKRAVREARGVDFQEALAQIEELYHDELMTTEDAEEGLRAFVEKRKPVWKDR